ncbi:MAG: hypothetical protein IK095_07110, partial [Oscillospiraceae bacterium]|nr:hypothetical protein [Oscillospiraceae bacterium]
MKREIVAVGLLLALVLGTVLDLRAADRLTGAVEDHLLRVEQAAGRGEREEALRELRAARSHWDSHGTYEQIFFRHPDLDAIQDA